LHKINITLLLLHYQLYDILIVKVYYDSRSQSKRENQSALQKRDYNKFKEFREDFDSVINLPFLKVDAH